MTSDLSSFPPRLVALREKLVAFMKELVYPTEPKFCEHQSSQDRWKPHPLIEELKVVGGAAHDWLLCSKLFLWCVLNFESYVRAYMYVCVCVHVYM